MAAMAVAPVDDRVSGSGKRVKKLFGHVPTLMEVRAMATHGGVNSEDGNQRPCRQVAITEAKAEAKASTAPGRRQ